MAEFWELTPRETHAVIEAAAWRLEREQQRDIALAWHIAALSRSKRMPPLKTLLGGGGQTRVLEGEELQQRQMEHSEMVANLNLEKLTHG